MKGEGVFFRGFSGILRYRIRPGVKFVDTRSIWASSLDHCSIRYKL